MQPLAPNHLARRTFLKSATAALATTILKPLFAADHLHQAKPQTVDSLAISIPSVFRNSSGEVIANTRQIVKEPDAKHLLVHIRQVHSSPNDSKSSQDPLRIKWEEETKKTHAAIKVVVEALRKPPFNIQNLYPEGYTDEVVREHPLPKSLRPRVESLSEDKRDNAVAEYLAGLTPPQRKFIENELTYSAAQYFISTGRLNARVAEIGDHAKILEPFVREGIFSPEEARFMTGPQIMTLFLVKLLQYDRFIQKPLLEQEVIKKSVNGDEKEMLRIARTYQLKSSDSNNPKLHEFHRFLSFWHIANGKFKPDLVAYEKAWKETVKDRENFVLEQIAKNGDAIGAAIYGAGHSFQEVTEDWNKKFPNDKFTLVEITPTAFKDDLPDPKTRADIEIQTILKQLKERKLRAAD